MIIFYFPSHGKGGTQSLFISILELLSDYSINTGFVDYSKGAITSHFLQFPRSNISFFPYNEKFQRPSGKIVIVTPKLSLDFLSYFDGLDASCNVLFWNLFPDSLLRHSKIWGVNIPFLSNNFHKTISNYLLIHQGFAAMSDNGLEQIKLQTINRKDLLLPVFFKPVKTVEKSKDLSTNKFPLKILFIARFVNWKFQGIIFFLDQLKRSEWKKMFQPVIVTDNVAASKSFINEMSEYDIDEILFHESLSRNEIHKLAKDTEIVLAVSMGLSVLETACLGIPTIVIDAAYNRYKQSYRFRFLSQCDDYDLGDINDNSDKGGYDVERILGLVLDPNKRKDQGFKDFQAHEKLYGLDTYLPSLLKFINNTEVLLPELQEIILSHPIYKLRRGIKRLKQLGKSLSRK